MTDQYYNDLAPFYHLIYEDWEAQVHQQGQMLQSVLQEHWPAAQNLLDAACGIGTQILELARQGYTMSGSDISIAAVDRLQQEATVRNLTIDLRVADMRSLSTIWHTPFDVVLAYDNAIPHLLSDDDISAAFHEFAACTRSGGGCLITETPWGADAR